MDFNSIIFPAPTDDKGFNVFMYKDELIYIPKQNDQTDFHIPCLLKKSKVNPFTDKMLIFFHGNAEDIFIALSSLTVILNNLPVPH